MATEPATHATRAAVKTPTRVLFIAGFGRSGSTLLGQILGATPGFAHVGELNFVWEHNFLQNRDCGCGAPFRECPFWEEVIGRAFGGFDGVDAHEMREIARATTRTRHGVYLLGPGGRSRVGRRASAYLDTMERLYASIRDVAGAAVVVDSSKLPQYGFLLGALPQIDLRVVHLVRDPRATAYSWLRRPRTEGTSSRAYLPRIGTAESALTWVTWNVVAELMWRHDRDRYLRLRYEDLVADPHHEVWEVLALAGCADARPPFVDGTTVRLAVAHTVAGNPNRFERGDVTIRNDEEWRTRISRPQAYAVNALTLPLMRRYGYALSHR